MESTVRCFGSMTTGWQAMGLDTLRARPMFAPGPTSIVQIPNKNGPDGPVDRTWLKRADDGRLGIPCVPVNG